ncbi:MAG: hypothetical protein H7Y86_05325 [Rhizobacter sp.]|nr:hypothetical protein [Ferruginibacter sp.]
MKKSIANKDAAPVKGNTKPIKNKEQVQESNDEKIDQDFPGFPHAPATEDAIKKKKTSTKL